MDLNELDMETAYYVEYFSMKRKAKEEQERFKALAEILKRCFGK